MTATRRLAAILAADIAGYSRLIGVDEEGILNLLGSIRAYVVDPSIAQCRGGDGLLAEFSSVVDVLRCATQWQHRMAEGNAGIAAEKRIEFRLGVHLGDIIVGDDDIFGDEMNVAARLEGVAEPGGICVPAHVQEDIAGARAAAVVKARNTPMTATVPVARIAPFRRLWIETSI